MNNEIHYILYGLWTTNLVGTQWHFEFHLCYLRGADNLCVCVDPWFHGIYETSENQQRYSG